MRVSATQLVAAARGADARVALELQWDTEEDDDMHVSWLLALHVIVARPGTHHSAYSTIELARLPAEALAERRDAHALATAVAHETGLALHAPSVEAQGGRGGSAWIRAQPPGPRHPYELAWETRWWTDDGEPARAEAVEQVPSTSGYDASITLSRSLLQRFSSRPLTLAIRDGSPRTIYGAGWPAGLPARERVRDAARDAACRASAVARAVIADAPKVTNLSLMIAFHESFEVPLEALAPIVRWRNGELDDAGLDAALPQIDRRRLDWDRPRRLREVRASGQSVAAFIAAERDSGTIRLMKDLMEAFSLSLGDAKQFVDACRDPDRRAALDRLLDTPSPNP